MESLQQQCQQVIANNMQNPESRFIVSNVSPDDLVTAEVQNALSVSEAAYLPQTRGRIMGIGPNGNHTVNPYGKIDGARFIHHDGNNIIIRVDHSTIPEFWMEINFTMDQLKKWMALYSQVPDEQDDEVDELEDTEEEHHVVTADSQKHDAACSAIASTSSNSSSTSSSSHKRKKN